MFSIGGVQFPDEARITYDTFASLVTSDAPSCVMVETGEGQTGCPNCHDLEMVILRFLSRPVKTPAYIIGVSYTAHQGRWWRIKTHAFQCPVCTAPTPH